MSGIEIQAQVNALQDELHEQLKTFILSGRVAEIMDEIEGLRKKCTHEFVNGTCIFCGQEEE